MKIKDLIKFLQSFQNPDADVILHNRNGKDVIMLSRSIDISDKVIIQSEDDIDMLDFLHFIYEEDDECNGDIYVISNKLMNIGITPECIEKYLGKSKADEYREEIKIINSGFKLDTDTYSIYRNKYQD